MSFPTQLYYFQANKLPENQRDSEEVTERLEIIDERYNELLSDTKERKEKLDNAKWVNPWDRQLPADNSCNAIL